MRSKRVHLALLAAIASALILSQAAAAEPMPVRYNAADQAAARAAVLKSSDLGGSAGWKGGLSKPDLSESPCGGYDPKRSDLLVTGAAESQWTHTSGLSFASEVWVLKTPAMVRLDWQRSVEHRGYAACLFKKAFVDATTKLVSFKQTTFPKLATLTRRYRLLVDYTGQAQRMRIMVDVILVGKGGPSSPSLAIAPYAGHAAVEAAELRLARALVSRVRA